MAQPYIGVTGPTDVTEVRALKREFEDAGYTMDSPHVPMIGFLVSQKTLNFKQVANLRYPDIDTLPELLSEAAGTFRTIHYTTPDADNLAEEVTRLFQGIYKEGLCRAVQLNVVFPPPDQVGLIKGTFPKMQIIFAANRAVMTSRKPEEEIARYARALDYVLIDPSGGRGIPFELTPSLDLYRKLAQKMPQTTMGFAGGLTAENVEQVVANILRSTETTAFSLDAEGGLRDKLTQTFGDDILNIEKVRNYLVAAHKVLP
jgi:phosphoribosylanthranilate isomerase